MGRPARRRAPHPAHRTPAARSAGAADDWQRMTPVIRGRGKPAKSILDRYRLPRRERTEVHRVRWIATVSPDAKRQSPVPRTPARERCRCRAEASSGHSTPAVRDRPWSSVSCFDRLLGASAVAAQPAGDQRRALVGPMETGADHSRTCRRGGRVTCTSHQYTPFHTTGQRRRRGSWPSSSECAMNNTAVSSSDFKIRAPDPRRGVVPLPGCSATGARRRAQGHVWPPRPLPHEPTGCPSSAARRAIP